MWIILWTVTVTLAHNAGFYAVDSARGIYSIYGDQHSGQGWRYCSLSMLPVHVVIIWFQSVAVCIVGTVIGWRNFVPRQILYLATWAMGLGLLGACLATLYEVIWDTFLGQWLSATWPLFSFDWSPRVYNVAYGLRMRSFDLCFGLLAGLAVGTVVGRRRWIVALVSAGILYAGFPLYLSVQGLDGYLGRVHGPLRDAVLGPPPEPPDLSEGPTFSSDAVAPGLTGHWDVQSKTGQDMAIAAIVIDSNGSLTHFRVADPGSKVDLLFVADEEFHEIEVTGWDGNPATVKYRCFGGCSLTESKVEINTRLEWYVRIGGPNSEEIPTTFEHAFIGQLDETSGVIEGKNLVVIDSRLAVTVHPRRGRYFVMRRVPVASQSRTP